MAGGGKGGASGLVMLYCPCPDLDTAKRLGRRLIEERLAGCVNILPAMTSIYEWEGRVEEAGEAVLLVKTSPGRAAAAARAIEAAHPYDVPAILTLPIADVSARYRTWLLERIG